MRFKNFTVDFDSSVFSDFSRSCPRFYNLRAPSIFRKGKSGREESNGKNYVLMIKNGTVVPEDL